MEIFDDELVLVLSLRSPVMLVYLAAILGAVISWRRHPRVSALVLGGAVILLAAIGLQFFWDYLLIAVVEDNDMLDLVDFAVVWALPFVEAIGMALLVAAVFVGRRTPTVHRFDDE